MTGILVRKTFASHLTTLRFLVGAAVTSLLFVAVAVVQLSDYDARLQSAGEFEARQQDFLDGITAWSMVRTVLVMPPSETAFMAKGITSSEPNLMYISAGRPASLLEMQYYNASNPLLDFLPDADVTQVAALLISLLAIILTYDLISGARERGMLRMLMATGMGRNSILLGLALGSAATLLLTVVLSIGCVLALLALARSVPILRILPQLSMLTGEILIYGFVFIAVGLLCSCLSSRSNISLLISLLIWLVLVIVLPAMSRQVVTKLDPLPSTESLEVTERGLDQQFQEELVSFFRSDHPQDGYYGWNTGNIFDLSLANVHYVVRSPYDSFIDFRRELRGRFEPLRVELVDRIQSQHIEFENRMLNQADLVELVGSVSPAAVLKKLCTIAAGTDRATLRRFLSYGRRLRQSYIDFQRSKDYRSLDWTTDQHRNREKLNLAGMPPTLRQRWDCWDALAHSLPGAAVLIVQLAVLLVACAVVFSRYDVR